MLLTLLLVSVLAYLTWSLVCLEINVRKARALNVPVVRIPFDPNGYTWVIFQPLFWNFLDLLRIPRASCPDFIRFTHRNWQFLEKSRPTEQFGSAWALVNPAGIHLHFSDPETIEDIYSRWREFIRPVHKYQMLALYGPSVFTVELETWSRHRKAVVAPFSESLMNVVWDQSLRHTTAILRKWTTQHEGESPDLQGDLRALIFNVLATTAFPQASGREGATKTTDAEATANRYREVLVVVLTNVILLMLVPYRYLTRSLVPERLARVGRAAATYKSILLKVLADETKALNQNDEAPGDILLPLVRARDTTEHGKDVNNGRKSSLSTDEILGNFFNIHFAGQDTVLITLTFALSLLAASPDVQEWIREEIELVFRGQSHDAYPYGDVFPKLSRCRAVLLESLRLYSPVTGVPKVASDKAPRITLHDGRELNIPPGFEVHPLMLGMHTDPRFWEDPLVWRPSRWIKRRPGGNDEELVEPRRGTFFPWSDGLQNCVGKKFSQVEGVAVLARIFQGHRLRIRNKVGETDVQARERVRACVDDVNYNMLLRMNHPQRVMFDCEQVVSR